MALHPHSIDTQPLCLEIFYKPADGLPLGRLSHGVVVIVEFGVGVGLVGSTECYLYELLAQQVEVWRLAEGAVVLDGLVHHVPSVHQSPEVSHHGFHMLYEPFPYHLLRCRCGAVSVGEPPVWGLRVPYQAVAYDLQAVLLAVAHELVGHAEVEDALCRGQCLRLHAVLCHGAVEVPVGDGIGFRHLSVALPLVVSCAYKAVLAHGILQALRLCRSWGNRKQHSRQE